MKKLRPRASAPIAVVGMALRVAGADTPARFWRNLVEGRDCLSRVPPRRQRLAGVPQSMLANPDFVPVLPVIDGVDRFDAAFFDLSAREAADTDPSHRLFLECAWEALEAAGIVPGPGAPATGVFGGCEHTYHPKVLQRFDDPARDGKMSLPVRLGNSLDFLSTRVSHRLDLTGPSFGVLAACATSLLAVDLAVQSLRRGECDVALAGGATIDVAREVGYLADIEGMVSPTGRLRPFDAAADGTIFGSGVGVVALRPLEDAIAAGQPIHAVILGAGSSNDGRPPGKESFIAPSPEGQVAAIRAALADADVPAATIGYVEAHGTGTLLGDPVEVAALGEVYGRATDRRGYCSIGSVKANIGHVRCAAGVASLIKACLALERATLPPLANFSRPNPRIDFERSPFRVHGDARPWPAGEGPRRAAVSSFGFGGSNVHVVLESAPARPATPSSRRVHFLPVSARTPGALARGIERLRARVEDEPGLAAADVAHTLQSGRKAFEHRALFVAEGDRIDAPARALRTPVATGVVAQDAGAVFLFPGQGAQRFGAGRGLYEREPVFREVVDACAATLARHLDVDVRALLGYVATATPAREAAGILRRTANAQPALFVVEYATASLLRSRGATPVAMLGHSLGELVAACVAGVFSLDDGLRLVAARARLMQECEPGAMAAIFLPASELEARLPAALEIAAVNAPFVTVVSGPGEAVASFCVALEREGVASQPIETSHAFHSRMMDAALPGFARVLGDIELHAPREVVISNATGRPLTAAQATDPAYWSRHLREPVRFSAGVIGLVAEGRRLYAEVGPGTTLGDLVRRHDAGATVVPTLAAAAAAGGEPEAVRAALGSLWCAGAAIDWRRQQDAGERRAFVSLPTYPFERERHWRDEDGVDVAAKEAGGPLYQRGFVDAPLDAAPALDTTRPWLVVGASPLADAIEERLRTAGAAVTRVVPGEASAEAGPGRRVARLDERADMGAAIRACAASRDGLAPIIVHAGAVTGAAAPQDGVEAFEAGLATGFRALVALAQGASDEGLADGMSVLAVADGLARLDGEPGEVFAEKSAVLGVARVIPRELAGLTMRVADVPIQDGAPAGWLVDALCGEALVRHAPTLACLRADGRRVEQLFALPPLAATEPRLRENGVVLITGGTGALGLKFSEALFDQCRARLVLTSRWEPPPDDEWEARAKVDDRIGRSLAELCALRARGAEILVVAADAASRDDLERAIAAARARFGGLHGVIHAAGVLDPMPVVEKTRESAARVFAPKVHAAFHLEALLADEPLDLYVPVSSAASQKPVAGQSDYAAANAVLDAIAFNRARRHRGLSCAIGWGPWRDIGFAADGVRRTMGAEADRGTASRPVDHPVLKSVAGGPAGARVYRGTLRPGDWIVDDHRFEGVRLLAGTGHLSLVTGAFALHAPGGGVIELQQVGFERPAFVGNAGVEIEIAFVEEGDAEAWTLRTRATGSSRESVVHSTGLVRRIASSAARIPVPPPRAWEGAKPGRIYSLVAPHVSGGTRWTSARQEFEHEGDYWVRAVIDAGLVGDLPAWPLHPGFLDNLVIAPRLVREADTLPHTYDAVRVHAPLEPEVLVRLRSRHVGGALTVDAAIVAPDGRVLVDVEGYTKRPIAGTNLAGGPRGEAADAARRVAIAVPGDLSSFRIEPLRRRAPGPGEVEIEVRAAALNFRDVLAALGEVPGAEPGVAPGSECSGIVCAVGPGVEKLRVGDPVVAIARGALATHVTCAANGVAALPANLDPVEAAGLPIVFLTAHYALEVLGRLAPGERVLIHAAAGGVGLAAIQIARALGAEIIATAGHPEKRSYLHSLGIEHVFDSRSLAFADDVRRVTGGEGVDVVLNSLAGEFIGASLRLLRPQGRFIEIGKRDLLADTPIGLGPFLENLSFSAFDLGRLVHERHPSVPAMFDRLMDRFATGELRPPPTEVVPLAAAADGFRRMARAQHIGKIVFEVRAEATSDRAVVKAFEAIYGHGIEVEAGVAQFRRLVAGAGVPPYVLAMGALVEGAGQAVAKVSGGAGRERGREALSTAYRAAAGEIESRLVALWEKTLGIAPIGVDDHFFDLGGDSIEAIQIQSAIRREFGLRVKNTEFLTDPTIAGLATLIAARRDGGAARTTDAARRDEADADA